MLLWTSNLIMQGNTNLTMNKYKYTLSVYNNIRLTPVEGEPGQNAAADPRGKWPTDNYTYLGLA